MDQEDDDVIKLNLWTLLPPEEIGEEIKQRVHEFNDFISSVGFKDAWKKQWAYYNGIYGNGVKSQNGPGLQTHGSNGEFLEYNENQVRAIVDSVVGMLLQQPPNFDVVATNTESKSNQLVGICRSAADYYMRNPKIRLSDRWKTAANQSYILDSGYILTEFDFAEIGPGGSTGEIVVSNPEPFDVTFSTANTCWMDHDWVIVRQWRPRASLIRQFPQLQDEIQTQINNKNIMSWDNSTNITQQFGNSFGSLNDSVLTYKFFHRKTKELPDGKYVWVLGDGTPLLSYDLPYDHIPVDRLVVHDFTGTCFGRSPIKDLMPMQEALNLINSSNLTNLYATQFNLIAVAEGSDLEASQLGTGVVLVRHPQNSPPPQTIVLGQLSEASVNFANQIKSEMNQIVGISEVNRGGSAKGVTAGNALALQASLAAQSCGPFIQAFNEFVGRQMTTLLKILLTYGNDERLPLILGVDKAKSVLKIQDPTNFDRVTVVQGNALASSVAGRLQMAENMLQIKAISPQQYLQVLQTGNLDDIMDPIEQQADYIQSENEALIQGKQIQAIIFDNHQQHIAKHLEILNNVDYRSADATDPNGPMVLQAVQAHLQQHMQFMAPPPAPPGAPGSPPGAPPSPQGGPPMPTHPPAPMAPTGPQNPGQPAPGNPEVQQANASGVHIAQPAKTPFHQSVV